MIYRTRKTDDGSSPCKHTQSTDVVLGQGILDGGDEDTRGTTDNGSLSRLVEGIVRLERLPGLVQDLVGWARFATHGVEGRLGMELAMSFVLGLRLKPSLNPMMGRVRCSRDFGQWNCLALIGGGRKSEF